MWPRDCSPEIGRNPHPSVVDCVDNDSVIRATLAVFTALCPIFVAGCTPPDRSAVAEHIADQVALLSGVDAVSHSYINDFENGAQLNLQISIGATSERQIATVAGRVHELMGDGFAGHRNRITYILVEGSIVDTRPMMNTESVSVAAKILRTLGPQFNGETVEVRLDESQMTVGMLRSPADTDDAVRTVAVVVNSLDAAPPVVAEIRSPQPALHNSWSVQLPLSPAELDRIVSLRDSLPVVVLQLGVRGDRIVDLSVDLGDPTHAYDNAAAMLAALSPSGQHPVGIQWRMAGAPSRETGRFVACAEPGSPPSPAVATYETMRQWFDGQYARCSA